MISSDKKKFETNKKVMPMSGLIKDYGDESQEEIPLPNAPSSSLEKEIKYCEYHYEKKQIVPLEKPLNNHI